MKMTYEKPVLTASMTGTLEGVYAAYGPDEPSSLESGNTDNPVNQEEHDYNDHSQCRQIGNNGNGKGKGNNWLYPWDPAGTKGHQH